MLFNVPLAIWLGFAAFISFVATMSFGVAMFYFKKKVFKLHRIFAYLTIIIVIIHVIFAILLWFYGMVI
jgi:hypothetical protein